MAQAPPPYQVEGQPPQQPGCPPQVPGYPARQPGYPPSSGYGPPPTQPMQTSTAIFATQPAQMVSMPVVFNESPVVMTCPLCKAQIVTSVEYEPGSLSYFICCLMCLLGCSICSCIPFGIDSCNDAIHSCPKCSSQLGAYRRM